MTMVVFDVVVMGVLFDNDKYAEVELCIVATGRHCENQSFA
jgi:hypothetical protein